MADQPDDLGAEAVGRVVEFVIGLDRLKGVERRTYISDGSRRENSAEHSWHLALMAMVLTIDLLCSVDRLMEGSSTASG